MASQDLNTLIARQLKRQRPKDTDGSGTFDVSLSSDTVLSKIRYVLRTGIEPFDEVLGGLPFGRVVEIFGLEGCGKTATCVRALVKAQVGEIYEREVDKDTSAVTLKKMEESAMDVATVFIDNEQSIDEDQKVKVEGVELECIVARCDTIDQLFKIVEVTIDKMHEKQDEEIEAAKKERRPAKVIFTVIVCDTIAGTSSKQEMTKEWNKEDYQRQPKMLREGFRRVTRKISRNNVLMICTNQVSETFTPKNSKSSIPQADDYATFGGRALRYYASTRVFMYPLMDNYKVNPNAKFSQGFLIGFYTKKNRVAKPCRTGRLVLLFNGGLNNLYSKLETMIYLGMITYSKSTKRFTFRFSKAGINTTTFGSSPATEEKKKKSAGSQLEEDDDVGRPRSDDPEMDGKKDWPAFYEAHKADCDLLWEKSRALLFDDNIAADVDDTDDDDGKEDLDLDLD